MGRRRSVGGKEGITLGTKVGFSVGILGDDTKEVGIEVDCGTWQADNSNRIRIIRDVEGFIVS